ncbi:MAG: tRNA (N(6)-L-threonylcarbamoyladenosine(37)-C(2))-methylthiotransferase MtaB [Spirochaetales bacterium]|nr:tRNA (N(6)-L-threonylcarbamoyladenosine(37)-C(2))-methylthiotransferase MtaB [Spirochaetales bacterium]
MKIALYTLGCKLNQCETEAIASVLREQGYTIVSLSQDPDLCIINTCTVTTKSEQKARRVIRSCAKKNSLIPVIITGCYAQVEPDECTRLYENAIVVPQDKKDKLLDFFTKIDDSVFAHLTPPEQKKYIIDFMLKEENTPSDPFAFNSGHFEFHSRGFLKIQDGCNCFCSYCRIPYARGRSVSLCPEEIFKRITLIEQAGYGEIVLTGINISAYNHSGMRIHELLKSILSLNGRARFRLSSLEPESIDEDLAEILSHPRICPHFHIPVQSGSDRILASMKRRYNAQQVSRAVQLLQEARPGCFLGADVLSGFPDEQDSDHDLTVSLLQECGFSKLHVFRFSPRPGTAAYSFPHRVRDETKKRRSQDLLILSDKLFQEYNARWNGRIVEVLLEKKQKLQDNNLVTCVGLSNNYIRLAVRDIPRESAFSRNLINCCIEEPETQEGPGKGKYI